MNEQLIVKSFGPVRELDITFKKVTLFIGDQGTGKSCAAKLFSMFKWLEKDLIRNKYSRNYFEQHKRFLTKLCAYHRMDSFVKPDSYIKFEGNQYEFVYSDGSFRIHDKKADADLLGTNNQNVDGIAKIMYVPAERSIVSVAENKTKLLKELPDSSETFSDEFVNAKRFFKSGYVLPLEGLHFKYDSLNKASWVSSGDYKVRLINASSGIQSSLPMCMVSEYLSKIIAVREEIKLSKEEKDRLEKRVDEIMQDDDIADNFKNMIRQLSSANRYDRFINIVEEPELNLFPKSQMEVLRSLVAINSSSEQNMLVLTTHSPYSLAILNMLVMGAKAYQRATKSDKAEIERILPPKYHLDENDVVAYRLSSKKEEDYCVSIINSNTKMIAKNDLDSCSDEINRIFNQLYRLYANTFEK